MISLQLEERGGWVVVGVGLGVGGEVGGRDKTATSAELVELWILNTPKLHWYVSQSKSLTPWKDSKYKGYIPKLREQLR